MAVVDRGKTVSFSGYRPEKLPCNGDDTSGEIIQLKGRLHAEIESAILNGYDTFIVGMAAGFDTYAALEVIRQKQVNNHLRLICALPFTKSTTDEAYQQILDNSDETVTLSDPDNRGAYHIRNEYLVDNCSLLICYYDGLAGGTEYTVDYANRKGITVKNIAPAKQALGGFETFNNTTHTVRDDLDRTIRKGSKISIAGACFSIYAYNELKKRLNGIESLRFIFTSPTFVTDKIPKDKREFYIPRLTREKSLYGTEFEVKLRNELTQKAIAKECADWIEKKVSFKSNVTNENMPGFVTVENGDAKSSYIPLNSFTTADIGCERGNNAYSFITKLSYPANTDLLNTFDEIWNDKNKLQDVTDEVVNSIASVYRENPPEFIYFLALYNIFNEFLEDISEDVLPNEATGFKDSKIWNMLYNFQKDAVLAIINKLEKYNGCILADSVGLGKTFEALAVVKYYENRNKTVLVLCPKKLSYNWSTYQGNYLNNPIAADRLRYDVLYHTDLSRTGGYSGGTDLSRINWSNYDLVVIDESHNFRNGGKLDTGEDEKQNRYLKLLNNVIKKGVKTKVLMLSATPVNNRFNDLKNQLQLAYEGDSRIINEQLNTKRPIDEIFKNAQTAFNAWSDLEPGDRTTDRLLKMLDFDFFELLDSVTIARSRKHIEKYYDTSDVGKFPTRLPPISHRPPLTDLKEAINYNQIFKHLMLLNLSVYAPSEFIQESRKGKYAEIFGDNTVNVGFTQESREKGIRRLMGINLMKRLESSVYAFRLTLSRIKELIENTISSIDTFDNSSLLEALDFTNVNEFDDDDLNNDELFTIGKKVKIDLADMDYTSWKVYLEKDREILELLSLMIEDITPVHDSKLQKLISVMNNKIENPINSNNKKIILFTAFADTADYLYDNLSGLLKDNYDLHTAMVTGSVEGRSTINSLKCDLNSVLSCFSPISKEKSLLMPNDTNNIDILIATDCISEGQNLQDCDYLINYDIHWNPVRIIQRFGRIDRIGSKNDVIQLVNFWPDVSLDSYINLKARVETRMKISVMTSTGDDDLINMEEKGDLEYRKAQLERLQEEVVDIEEMSTGISIMDLGLNEFRLDLLDYVKNNGNLDKVPFGMHAVTAAEPDAPAGVIYILKNRTGSVNIDNQNRLHPFYMVYITNEGEIVCDHLSPKNMLDKMRYICKGKTTENAKLCVEFNKKTNDGRNMDDFSELLSKAISSVIQVKEESDIMSFLSGGDFSFKSNVIKGLDDFELVCFIVVA